MNLIPYKAYINHWTNLRKAETKRKKELNFEDWEKETSDKISLKKVMKRQGNTAQMKEQTKSAEVQINEEEIGKLSEKIIQNNHSKDDKKTLKIERRKCKNQFKKTKKN